MTPGAPDGPNISHAFTAGIRYKNGRTFQNARRDPLTAFSPEWAARGVFPAQKTEPRAQGKDT
ncbi:hypothetical protein AA0535_2435 [Asaia krungthepensis NRIC 0535]|uniref:Uncharacterized protein n=1 Tax=Asaia krungthepensis NRIC 0535 TaxID=1307925 RepID=A0ABQ0Q566_9PROT|nr:hypothetical protein AA0535_2435 [Asaia krungthepensis NRIC 0535]